LLREGERALESGGAAGLSLREVARAIGVSHAAPRRHFADKQALLDALAEAGFARLGADLDRVVDEAGPGSGEQLAALARAYVAFAGAHPALLELMFAAKTQADAPPQLRDAAERAFAAPLAVIAERQARGDNVDGERALQAVDRVGAELPAPLDRADRPVGPLAAQEAGRVLGELPPEDALVERPHGVDVVGVDREVAQPGVHRPNLKGSDPFRL